MNRPVDAVPVESNGGHRAGRDCPCGPTAMRDLATGTVSIWRHRPPPAQAARVITSPEASMTRWAGPRRQP